MGIVERFESFFSKDDEEVKRKLEALNTRVDGLADSIEKIERRLNKIEGGKVEVEDEDDDEQGYFDLELDQDEIRFEKGEERKSDDYDLPILVSLFKLGRDEYWNPRQIEDNWKDKYLELNSGDLEKEEIEMAHGTVERYVYRNRHAWSLVNLQKEDLIEKNGHKKEYKITKKGVKKLKQEDLLK